MKRAFQINKKIVGVFKGRLLFFSCERLTVERLLIQKADAKCKIVRNEKSKSNYLLTYSTYRKEFSCPIFEVFQTNTSLFLLMFLFLLLILFLFLLFTFDFAANDSLSQGLNQSVIPAVTFSRSLLVSFFVLYFWLPSNTMLVLSSGLICLF